MSIQRTESGPSSAGTVKSLPGTPAWTFGLSRCSLRKVLRLQGTAIPASGQDVRRRECDSVITSVLPCNKRGSELVHVKSVAQVIKTVLSEVSILVGRDLVHRTPNDMRHTAVTPTPNGVAALLCRNTTLSKQLC